MRVKHAVEIAQRGIAQHQCHCVMKLQQELHAGYPCSDVQKRHTLANNCLDTSTCNKHSVNPLEENII